MAVALSEAPAPELADPQAAVTAAENARISVKMAAGGQVYC